MGDGRLEGLSRRPIGRIRRQDVAGRRNQRPGRLRHDAEAWRASLPLPNIKPDGVSNYAVRLSLYIVLFAVLSAISERMTQEKWIFGSQGLGRNVPE